MAGLTLLAQDLPLVLGLAVMAAEAVRQGGLPQLGSLRIVRERLAVEGHVPPRDDDRVALDRLVVHYARVAGRAAFALSTLGESLHVLAMAHDQANILDRRRQVPDRDFRDAEDGPVTAQAD